MYAPCVAKQPDMAMCHRLWLPDAVNRNLSLFSAVSALLIVHSAAWSQPQRPTIKVVQNGESSAKPDDCRGIIVGPGVHQPDPFPGYRGFVGWESPIRLSTGESLVGFNAGYWHASSPTLLTYSPDTVAE